MLRKTAKILTELQPHQREAVAEAIKHNIILAHSTGSGKTLSAIAAADAIGKPVTVFTPAPLVENFKKELSKHEKGGPSFDVRSLPTAVSRNMRVPAGNTVIIDEAHLLRNPTARQQYLKNVLSRAGRIIALTGTPAYNQLEDWVPLVNTISQENVFPSDASEFHSKYVDDVKVSPGFFAEHIMGIKPGVVQKLQHKEELKKRMSRYVNIFDKDIEKPERIDQTIEVEMSPEQKEMYDFVRRKMPYSISYKIGNNLPPSKSEAKGLNTFLAGVRQVSNTTQAYHSDKLSAEDLEKDSPKLHKALDELMKMRKNNPNTRAFIYSNYLDSGIVPLARMLAEKKIPYGVFKGGIGDKERAKIVNDYNTGKTPVLLGTGAATEGLDLRDTSLIQILEPHFNNSRIEQAIGRGIRYKSHEDLPPEQRKVVVQRYVSTLPDSRSWFGKLTGDKPDTSVDQYLMSRSSEKDRVIAELKDLLERRA